MVLSVAVEIESIAPTSRLPQADQPHAALHYRIPTPMPDYRLRQLLITAADVEALIRLAEDFERRWVRLKGEEIHQIERGLLRGVRAIFDGVGGVEEEAEWRIVPALDARLNPVEDAHVVEILSRPG